MKKLSVIILFSLVLHPIYAQSQKLGKPVAEPSEIFRSFTNWGSYITQYVNFYQDCVAYDANSNPINREQFLQLMCSEKYFPLRLMSNSPTPVFKLIRMTADQRKHYAIYGYALMALGDYKKERKQFPQFSFTDLKGNLYNRQNTKDKIIVLKCWFVACSTCEVQRPAYNQLVGRYKNRKDVIFMSLAEDAKPKVEAFVKTKPMDYAVVPNQQSFIEKQMNVNAFPTYFIIDKKGTVVRVMDTPDDVDYELKKL